MRTLLQHQVARIQGEELGVDLREHMNEVISVHLGYTALLFTTNIPKNQPMIFGLQSKDNYLNTTSRISVLEPGTRLQLGRMHGVEVLSTAGNEEILGDLDPMILETIRSDEYISREHVQVSIIGPAELIVKDLGSTNGTFIKEVVESPEYRRSRLRLVK